MFKIKHFTQWPSKIKPPSSHMHAYAYRYVRNAHVARRMHALRETLSASLERRRTALSVSANHLWSSGVGACHEGQLDWRVARLRLRRVRQPTRSCIRTSKDEWCSNVQWSEFGNDIMRYDYVLVSIKFISWIGFLNDMELWTFRSSNRESESLRQPLPD